MKDLVTTWRSLPICDFCGFSDVKWRYPCKDFDMRELAPWGSVGDFAACETCSFLSSRRTSVESSLYDLLRSLTSLLGISGTQSSWLYA